MSVNVHHIPIDYCRTALRPIPIPPSLWLSAEDGELPPVQAVKKGLHYELVNGIEIWQAAQLAQLDRIPAALVGPDSMPPSTTSPPRSPYYQDPITEAHAIELLKEARGLSDAALGKYLGWSRKQVADYRRLLRLEDSVREQVRAGRLSAAKAAELVSIPPSKQRQIANRTVQFDLSLADVRALARPWKTRRTPDAGSEARSVAGKNTATADFAPYADDPDVARLERQLEEQIGCRVRLDTTANRLTIDYGNGEVLDGLLARLAPQWAS